VRVAEADLEVVRAADLLVVGGPTHIRGMTSGMSRKMGLTAEEVWPRPSTAAATPGWRVEQHTGPLGAFRPTRPALCSASSLSHSANVSSAKGLPDPSTPDHLTHLALLAA
jgi:hypothetical protein